MIIAFTVVEIAQQAVLYFSHNCYEKALHGTFGLSLLAVIGLVSLFMCYLLFHRTRVEVQYHRYRVLIVCLVLSVGLTVISTEWSPWQLRPASMNYYPEDFARFIQLKNLEIALISIFFIYFGRSSTLGVVLYLIPSLYLTFRFEDFSRRSFELLAIPVLVLAAIPQLSFSLDAKDHRPSELEAVCVSERGLSRSEEAEKQYVNPISEHQVLLDALPEGIMVLNESGQAIQVNNALLNILDCSANEAQSIVFNLPDKDYKTRKQQTTKKAALKRAETVVEKPLQMNKLTAAETPVPDIESHRSKKLSKKRPSIECLSIEYKADSKSGSPIVPSRDNLNETAKKPHPKTLGVLPKCTIKSISTVDSKVPTLNVISDPATTSIPELPSHIWEISKKSFREFSKSHPREIGDDRSDRRGEEIKQETVLSAQLPEINEIKKSFIKHENKHELDEHNEESNQEIIEQIAEQQALSMKPHVDDLLEKLRSSSVRSAYATVGEAVESISSKFFKHSETELRTVLDLKLNFGHECARSNSDGLPEYFFTKKDVMSSAVINSYLKVSSSKVKYLEIKISPFIHRGKKLLLVLVRDDTQKDIARRLHLLDKQKASALASTVHDLRAPLGAIMSSLECIGSKTNDSDLFESFVKPASFAAKSLMFLINDILDIHQINMKKLQLSYIRTDLYENLRSIIEIFRLKAEAKGLALNLVIDESTPRSIVTDPNRLQQIIINLLSNALKFTEQGSITVQVNQHSQGRIRVAVIDTGIGIKVQDKSKLFTNFGKIHNKQNDKLNPQGVGLGLNISNKLAKMLCESEEINGLRVESTFGKGTEFYFIVDDATLDDETPQSHDSKSEQGTVVGRIRTTTIFKKTLNSLNNVQESILLDHDGIDFNFSPSIHSKIIDKQLCECNRVLVVDDNEFSIIATLNILKSLNIQKAEVARNGREAIDLILSKFKQNTCCKMFDLVLMDCQMPVMDGVTAALELKRLSESNQLPFQKIIGLSGYSSDEFKSNCKQAGMMEVLVKPLAIKDIKNLIAN